MSKVRPRRVSKPSSSASIPVVLNPKGTEEAPPSEFTDASSPLGISPSSTTSTTTLSDKPTKMLKHFPFHSDSGFGTLNPMFDDTGESAIPPDLPSPIKPTIPTSHSMPTMPTMSSTFNSLLSPQKADVHAVCSSMENTSFQASPNITPPPNTPLSPLSTRTSPKRSKSEAYDAPTSGHESSDLATPPNTPFSDPSSPNMMDYKEQHEYMNPLSPSDLLYYPNNPAMATRGQLYNILGYPVDLPNTKPLSPGRPDIQISPDDTGSKLYPFPKYPTPNILDSLSESEQVIKDLVHLGNGIYDAGNQLKGDQCQNLEMNDSPTKDNNWNKLEDKEQRVTACWNHNLDRPKVEDQTQKDEDHEPSPKKDQERDQRSPTTKGEKESPKADTKVEQSQGKDQDNKTQPSTTDKRRGSKEDQKRDSLYAKLKIPMIDDDVDCRKPDSPSPASNGTGSESSSLSLDLDILGPGAAELAEQLCDVTSEAGRLITKELQEGLNYLMQPEDTLEFTWIDAVTGVISIGAFYFDLASDALAAYYMYDDPDAKYWFRVTVLLLLIPLVIANGFSLYWYWFDERACEPQGACFRHPQVPRRVWALRLLAHVTLQASVLRQIDIMYYGTKSTAETVMREALVDDVMEKALVEQPEDSVNGQQDSKKRRGSRRLSFQSKPQDDPSAPLNRPASVCSRRTNGVCSRGGYVALWIHAERDAANVDLLLSLIQDAPLLIMHLYIITHTLPEQAQEGKLSKTIIMQMLSASASLLTLAWSVASFVRAIRLTEPTMSNLSLLDLLLLTLAHFCSIAGQVMSFALFASKTVVAFCIVGTIHWFGMSVWILIQLLCFPRTTCTRAVFAHDQITGSCSRLDDIIYSCTMGLIFLFTFVDVGGINTKTQSLLYHIFRLIEEAVLLTIWFVWINGYAWYHWMPLVLVPVFFCLNLLFDALFTASTKPVVCIPLSSAPCSL